MKERLQRNIGAIYEIKRFAGSPSKTELDTFLCSVASLVFTHARTHAHTHTHTHGSVWQCVKCAVYLCRWSAMYFSSTNAYSEIK